MTTVSIGTPVSTPLDATVTLAEIEREVARRAGPFHAHTVASATNTALVVDALKSSADLGGLEDLFLLRRSAAAGDRVRLVKTYDPAAGRLEVDRAYGSAPTAGEAIELHHLHPDAELRVAVLRGLERCYLLVETTVGLTAGGSHDLTTSLPWLRDTRQVYGVALAPVQATERPARIRWHVTVPSGTGVALRLDPDPMGGSVVLSARRPVSSLVNGVDSLTGPSEDDDALSVPLAYAAAAGHVEAWRRLKHRLLPVAQTGLAVSQEEAATEFTRQAWTHFGRYVPAQRVQYGAPW